MGHDNGHADSGWMVGGQMMCGWGAGGGGLCPVMGNRDMRMVGGSGAATVVACGGAGAGAGS